MTDKIKEAVGKLKSLINSYFTKDSLGKDSALSHLRTIKDEIQGMEEEYNRIIESWKKEEILWTGMDKKFHKLETLCKAVTKASGLIGPKGQLPMVPVAAIREILGLKAFPFKEERKRKVRDPRSKIRVKLDDDWEIDINPLPDTSNDNEDKENDR